MKIIGLTDFGHIVELSCIELDVITGTERPEGPALDTRFFPGTQVPVNARWRVLHNLDAHDLQLRSAIRAIRSVADTAEAVLNRVTQDEPDDDVEPDEEGPEGA